MTVKVDRRREALGELAAMIAATCRRRTAEGKPATFGFEEDSRNEDQFEIVVRTKDPESAWKYTETVKVDNFLGNNKSRAGKAPPKFLS